MEALHDVVQVGQGALHRREQHVRVAVREGAGAADAHGWTRFVSMQNHYNLVYREEEREMIPQCIDQGVGVLPWSPLARGLLAGNRTAHGERLTCARTPIRSPTGSTSPRSTSPVVDRVGRGRRRARCPERAARARVALAQAGRHGADRRRDQGRSTSRMRSPPSSSS